MRAWVVVCAWMAAAWALALPCSAQSQRPAQDERGAESASARAEREDEEAAAAARARNTSTNNASSTTASEPNDVPAPPPKSRRAPSSFETQLLAAAGRIEALLRQELDPSVDPATLFDVDLTDEHAIAVEAARLRALLSGGDTDAGLHAIVARGRLDPGDAGTLFTDSLDQSGDQAANRSSDQAANQSGEDSAVGSFSTAELAARLRLDHARLQFYSLERRARRRTLEAHAARQHETRASDVELSAGAAGMRAREAERQQRAALEAAQNARTEALRLLAEEQARLLGISAEQANYESELLARRSRLLEQQEELLSWQRQVRELLERARRHEVLPEAVNEFYTRLRTDLRKNRDQLSSSLAQIHEPSEVPRPGEDRLLALPPDVDASVPRAKRAEVEAEVERLQSAERQLDYEHVHMLYQSVVALNAERLTLYPYLTDSLRSAIVGFGPYGLDQARSELRQVMLTVRYSMLELRRWVHQVTTRGLGGQSALAVSLVALKWLIPIGVFVWWRRRADAWFALWHESARRERRQSDARVASSSAEEHVITFLQRIHRPLESLLLTLAVVWLLPHEAKTRLEVQLLATVFHWTFGGALVVAVIDALAERRGFGNTPTPQHDTSEVRLRSLRLLGRVVVALALVLSLSAELLGKGTVYAWVLSTCWFAAIPVLLVIAHWWKGFVYQRLNARRRKPPVLEWGLRQQGYKSLLVALAGGTFLMYDGALRAIKPIVADFDLSRRLLAYLFRRDLSKRADTTTQRPHTELPAKLYTQLGPSIPSDDVVPSVADAQVSLVVDRINQPGGGVFALVGERGSGKSTLLRRIVNEGDDARLVKCPLNAEELSSRLVRSSDAQDGLSLEEAARTMDQPERHTALLIDDAHRLVKPVMGGLRGFDEFLDMASRHSKHCAWVFAFDEVMWTFLERARGAKPLFDEVIELKPWGEAAIAKLLQSRCVQAGVTPKFDGLLGQLPRDADEIDKQEALARTMIGYHRLIWDYAAGNPGIALHTWRRCLARSVDDGEIVVSNFQAPDTRELESLPDEPSFVLRAIVQLEFARVDEIVGATRLPRAVVDSVLRFALVRNYLELRGDRYWITWAWYRPITRFLERKHLLARR